MTTRLLLNCDMGERLGHWPMGRDEEVMPWIDCANVACGFHASDPVTLRKTVALAARHGVQVGAHPGYPDLVGFGRRSLACTPNEVEQMVLYQMGAVYAACRAESIGLSYVKPHGALNHDMMRNPDVLEAIMAAVAAFDPELPLMVTSVSDRSATERLSRQYGITVWNEVFADRAYDAEGHLVSRQTPGAVHQDRDTIVAQAVAFANGTPILAHDGKTELTLLADTLCVHGDNEESIAAVQAVHAALKGGSP
ncbi:5-oxoprolinase subunit PxpA [Larsenimonas suaedae]|uniref:5-oxoprolinase subunit PxpA n=1 Tax=Larsenimonas suaedae TaxID=1851019 RepID=A0ABU1GT50_9GAMM|nr:5-oxoprolinase subunit PxpA [Larsenimonas suaedae]MCM2971652.1 5-oxoprolinase subunit PxpA [Larsenimonas suaedae]MDR5895204.1 5-oxoprolinase subunit PxpA [Larsenimonas suaedae]